MPENNSDYGAMPKMKLLYIILTRFFNLIALGIILLVFAAAYFYLLGPKRQEISEARASYLTEKTNQKKDLENILIKIEKYKADYNKIDETERKKIDNMFLADGAGNLETEKLFVLFESMIGSQGLILSSINISQGPAEIEKSKTTAKKAEKPVPGIGRVNIDLEVSGVNYESFKNLLDKLEKNLMIIDVTDVTFAPDGGGASLKIVMYYFK